MSFSFFSALIGYSYDLIELIRGRVEIGSACLGKGFPLFPLFPPSPQRDQTMHHVSASPSRVAHLYHDRRKNNINDFGLKSSIFFKVDVLLTSGRSGGYRLLP